MAGSKLVSRGTAYFAVISTLNLLLIMAAIANDGSVGNLTTVPTSTSSTSTSARITSPTTTSPPKALPSISSLVRGPSYDTVIKVPGGNKELPTKLSPTDNSTMSTLIDLINSSSTSPFTTQNWTEVRAQYKSNALLPCHVRNSGDGVTVSWIRRKDYHLLTVGLQTYASDDRFQAIHSQSPDDWTLKIKYVQPRDAGVYECQVSTHPPSSIFVTLSVVEATSSIIGGPEKIYKAGSTVELKCELIESTEEPEYLFWYQGLQMINYNSHINVTHYKSSSVLILQNVQKSQTGNYSCVPSNAHPASIFVHIINGENPAARMHGSNASYTCPPLWFLSFFLSLTLQALYFRFMSNHVDRYHERAHYTITSSSCPLSPPQKVPSSAHQCHTPTSQQCTGQLHHRTFHHNHHYLHLQSQVESAPNTMVTYKSSRNDDNHPHPSKPHELPDAHYQCFCKETERDSSISTSSCSTTRTAVERNQKSGTRSSFSSESNFALCCRWVGDVKGAMLLPVTTHSSKLTVR